MGSEKGISYRKVDGEGLPLVFVHGWLGSRKSWKLAEENLDLKNPKIFIDQRCHGNSYCQKFSIKDLAKDLKQAIDESCDKDPVLIGHSMGGMTALQYSTIYDSFAGLCLLGTCASTPEPEIESPEFFLEKFNELDREKWAEMITENYLGRVNDEELKKANKIELMEADEKPIVYGLQTMMDYDVRDELDVDRPSIVVAGEKDGAITMEKSEELVEILGCDLVRIDSGHLMLHERPGKIAEIIEEFVTKLT